MSRIRLTGFRETRRKCKVLIRNIFLTDWRPRVSDETLRVASASYFTIKTLLVYIRLSRFSTTPPAGSMEHKVFFIIDNGLLHQFLKSDPTNRCENRQRTLSLLLI